MAQQVKGCVVKAENITGLMDGCCVSVIQYSQQQDESGQEDGPEGSVHRAAEDTRDPASSMSDL